MSFLNKLIETAKDLGDKTIDKAKDLGDKAADQIEIQKLKGRISAQEKEIAALYAQAGKEFLEEHPEAAAVYFTEELEKIEELKLDITALEAEIELIRNKDYDAEEPCDGECEDCEEEPCESECDSCGAPEGKKIVCDGNQCTLVDENE